MSLTVYRTELSLVAFLHVKLTRRAQSVQEQGADGKISTQVKKTA